MDALEPHRAWLLAGAVFVLFAAIMAWHLRGLARFELRDLMLSVASYALVLSAVRHFLLKLSVPQDLMAPFAFGTLPLVVMSMFSGRENMDLFVARAVALRRLVYVVGALWPMCALPAVLVTLLMAKNAPSIRNDTATLLYWLVLLMPCLAQFWINSIKTLRRDDGEDRPR